MRLGGWVGGVGRKIDVVRLCSNYKVDGTLIYFRTLYTITYLLVIGKPSILTLRYMF